MAVIIKGIDILEPSAGTNSLQWAWQNGGPASGEVLIFGENGLLTNGTAVASGPGDNTTETSSSVDVSEFYPSGMNAADNLSNYPGFTNAMYFDENYLSRTITAAGNQKTWTYSGWVKRTKTTGLLYLLTNSPSDANNGISSVYFNDVEVYTYYDTTGTNPYGAVGPAKFRDASAWYHIIWAVDAANINHKVWVNNHLISTDTSKYPPNYNYDIGTSGQKMAIGSEAWGLTNYFTGYMANIQFIDGQALDPSYFGQYLMDADGNATSAWAPKLFDGTSSTGEADVTNDYGTNGFLLDFSKLGLNNDGDIDKVYDTAPILDSGGHTAANDWDAH